MTPHRLDGSSIDFFYGEKRALAGVYIQCETGRITGLLGRNGSGKSTLLNVLFGKAKSDSGVVRWNGSYVKHAYKKAGLISYMAQRPSTPGHLTCKQLTKLFGLDHSSIEKLKSHTLISQNYTTRFYQLSPGVQKFMEAAVFITSPVHFVLLDEPFSFLSPLQVEQLMVLLEDYKASKGIFLTDHQYRHVTEVSDDLYFLGDGFCQKLSDVSELQQMDYLP